MKLFSNAEGDPEPAEAEWKRDGCPFSSVFPLRTCSGVTRGWQV
jgi:hypothetical protein